MIFSKLTNIYLIVFFNLIVTASSLARGESPLPEYCSSYPYVLDGEFFKSTEIGNDEKVVFSQCIKNKLEQLSLNDLDIDVNDIQSKTLLNLELQFKEKLREKAIKLLISKRKDYQGIYFDESHQANSDKICNFEPVQLDVPVDATKREDFLTLNIINSFKALALFEINRSHYKDIERLNLEKNWSSNQCIRDKVRCKKNTPIYKDTEHCQEIYTNCNQSYNQNYDRELAILNKKIAPLFELVQTSPLLFNNSKDGELLGALNSNELNPSQFLNEIKKLIPSTLIHKMKDLLNKKDEKGIKSFFKQNAEFIANLVSDKNKSAGLYIASDKEIENDLEKLNNSAKTFCEGSGDNLHHYPFLVEEVLEDIYRNSSNNEILKHQVIATQAAYCQLLRNKPLEQNKTSAALISGFTLLGIGGVLQLIPLVGNISGGYIATVGTGLLISGGAVMTGAGVFETYDSHLNLNQEIGLHSVGLTGYNKVLEAKEVRDSNLKWAVLDAALLTFDLSALRHIKKSTQNKTHIPIPIDKNRNNHISLETTNGVEFEGILRNSSIEQISQQYLNWLEGHPSGLIRDVSLTPLGNGKYKINFKFDNKDKSMVIEPEVLNGIRNSSTLTGIEISSPIIETENDLQLLFEIQEQFYKFGVEENSTVAGLHNHLGLKGLLGRQIEGPNDPEIQDLFLEYEKIQDELLNYFGTHPYRNPLSGKSNNPGEVKTSNSKDQGILISKANNGAGFMTIELRLFNGRSDPEYLSSALSFNNSFLSSFFDQSTGLKDWMQSKKDITLEELYEKLGLDYNVTKHEYDVKNFRFDQDEDYLVVFNDDFTEALKFLEKHMGANIKDSKNLLHSFGELYNYLEFLYSKTGKLAPNIKRELSNFLNSVKSLFDKKGIEFNFFKTFSHNRFRKINPELKKTILELYLPKGIENSSNDELTELLTWAFEKNFSNYPFNEAELNKLLSVAKENNDPIDASSIIKIRYQDINGHILSINNFQDSFEKETYEVLINTNGLLTPESLEHLKKLIDRSRF